MILNSISSCWIKFKKWGIKGIITFITSKLYERQKIKAILSLAPKPYPKPIRGFTLIGKFQNSNSLSKVMRDFAVALHDIGIPFQTIDLSASEMPIPPTEYSDILTSPDEVHLYKFTHIIGMEDFKIPIRTNIKYSRLFFWEFDSGFTEAFPSLFSYREIVGMSDFNYEIFARAFPKNITVKKILYPFRFNIPMLESPSFIRSKYNLNVNDFIVFFNFDFASCPERKNPIGAVKAFAQAFRNIPDAKLVFKTMNAELFPNELQYLYKTAQDENIKDRFITINDYIPISELYSLTNTCDVYISLHRGEGFGLGIAEAMSLGKAVVVTDYSSTTEFCNDHNAILVPYIKSPIPKSGINHPNYLFVKEWADPNIEAAANGLKLLYEDPTLRKKLGDSARDFINNHFSQENFKKSVNEFLDS